MSASYSRNLELARSGGIGLPDVEHLVGQTAQILFIRFGHELGYSLFVGGRVEQLAPTDPRLATLHGERDGQDEVMAFRQMLEHDPFRDYNFPKDAFVRIVCTVGPVHDKTPMAAGP
jgi:hypothetical protein